MYIHVCLNGTLIPKWSPKLQNELVFYLIKLINLICWPANWTAIVWLDNIMNAGVRYSEGCLKKIQLPNGDLWWLKTPLKFKIRSKLKFILQKLLHGPTGRSVSSVWEIAQQEIIHVSFPNVHQDSFSFSAKTTVLESKSVHYLSIPGIRVISRIPTDTCLLKGMFKLSQPTSFTAVHLQSPRWHCPETRPKFITIRCNSLRIVEWPIAGHQELSHVVTPLIVPIEPTVGVCSIQAQPFQVVQVWGDENSKHGTSSILCYQNNRKMPPRFHTMIRFRS